MLVYFRFSLDLGFCFFPILFLYCFFSNKPRDWLGRTSLKWPILCRVGRKTITQSDSQFSRKALLAFGHSLLALTPLGIITSYRMFSCRRGTARRPELVQISSSTAQLHARNHIWKGFQQTNHRVVLSHKVTLLRLLLRLIVRMRRPSHYLTRHQGQLSLLPLSGLETSTDQSAVMPCGWDVMAGMAHSVNGLGLNVYTAGKAVWSSLTRAISERFTDE